MNDDVESANRGRRVVDEAGEADTIRDAEPRRGRLQFEQGHLASLGRVERPADDICADVERSREPGDRLEKYVVALPHGEGGEEADADDVAAAGGKTREAVQIELAFRSERNATGRRHSRSPAPAAVCRRNVRKSSLTLRELAIAREHREAQRSSIAALNRRRAT